MYAGTTEKQRTPIWRKSKETHIETIALEVCGNKDSLEEVFVKALKEFIEVVDGDKGDMDFIAPEKLPCTQYNEVRSEAHLANLKKRKAFWVAMNAQDVRVEVEKFTHSYTPRESSESLMQQTGLKNEGLEHCFECFDCACRVFNFELGETTTAESAKYVYGLYEDCIKELNNLNGNEEDPYHKARVRYAVRERGQRSP